MKVRGDTRVRVRWLVELRRLEQNGAGLVASLWNRVEARMERLEADGVVLATGFQRPRRLPLLESLAGHLLTRDDGEYQVARDYRVASLQGFAPGIYLQGFCESTHGLSDAVLSVLPIRSREIVDSLAGALARATRGSGLGNPRAAAIGAPLAGARARPPRGSGPGNPRAAAAAIPELESTSEPAIERGGR